MGWMRITDSYKYSRFFGPILYTSWSIWITFFYWNVLKVIKTYFNKKKKKNFNIVSNFWGGIKSITNIWK